MTDEPLSTAPTSATPAPPEHTVGEDDEPPAERFDRLYTRNASFLTRQAYLLCGHRQVAERAVVHAFHRAWEEWPTTTTEPDPGVVVRAATYRYALSPWHRLCPGRRLPEAHPGPPEDRDILEALLSLPSSYRAALLLHDGLGLPLHEAAEEMEASTPATAGRILHARQTLAQHWPELRTASQDRRSALIAARLAELAAAQPVHNPPAAAVRDGSERTTRGWTRAAFGLTAAVAVAIGLGLVTTDDGSAPQRSDPRATASPSAADSAVSPDAEPGPGHPLPGPGDPDGALGGNPVPQPRPRDGVPRGPGDTLPKVGPTGQAYMPQLRSTNRKVKLDEFAHGPGRKDAPRDDRRGEHDDGEREKQGSAAPKGKEGGADDADGGTSRPGEQQRTDGEEERAPSESPSATGSSAKPRGAAPSSDESNEPGERRRAAEQPRERAAAAPSDGARVWSSGSPSPLAPSTAGG